MDKLKQRKGLSYGILIFALVFTYCFMRMVQWSENGIQRGMIALLCVLLAVVFYLFGNGSLDEKKMLWFLIIAGMVMRIGYMLYTLVIVRGYDVWYIETNSFGHAGYLLNLIVNHQLPQTNEIQLYQQPFFYLCGSVVSTITNAILHSRQLYDYADAAKLVSCFASCAVLYKMPSFCKFLKVNEKNTIIVVAMVAFLPNMYLAGGRINPDMLATYLMILALFYTLQWNQEPSWKHTIILSLIYGCAMMTKISCGVMAIVTAVVFLKKFFIMIKEKSGIFILKKFLVFACVSFPLGLWYSVRNFLRFGQSLTYVLDIGRDSMLYVGNFSFVQRFLSFSIKNVIKTPYADAYSDYNYPVYLIKSALFGEFNFKHVTWLAYILLFVTICLSALVLVAIIKSVIRRQWDENHMILGVFSILLLASSVWFNIQYPYGCSMDFRYLIPLGVTIPLLFAKGLEQIQSKVFQRIVMGLVTMYGCFSCLVYLLLS